MSKKILPPEPEGNIVTSRRFISLNDLFTLSGLVSFFCKIQYYQSYLSPKEIF
ncbi:hypothetical protein LEP1GSC127_0129 [Leptospira kirschneri str. 200801925]|nr:hypothetical protein LEP1GSC127_0129 [Leptospira kirschneri str. 200801925]